jgi:hypothetical protein
MTNSQDIRKRPSWIGTSWSRVNGTGQRARRSGIDSAHQSHRTYLLASFVATELRRLTDIPIPPALTPPRARSRGRVAGGGFLVWQRVCRWRLRSAERELFRPVDRIRRIVRPNA